MEYQWAIVLGHNHAWEAESCRLMTGFVDHGEGSAGCAVREVKEELYRYQLVSSDKCVALPTGTGFGLRDWLRSKDRASDDVTSLTAITLENLEESSILRRFYYRH
ncbi:MAG: NUDIX domain-containing protein [Pseudomonadales bacterium]|nr:NUDIX domain-containing protein [Pseudomonadales bacterium]